MEEVHPNIVSGRSRSRSQNASGKNFAYLLSDTVSRLLTLLTPFTPRATRSANARSAREETARHNKATEELNTERVRGASKEYLEGAEEIRRRGGAPATGTGTPGGGGGGKGASSGITATDLPPEAGGFLDAISGPESAGKYNVRYTPQGGTTFDLTGSHPNILEPTKSGQKSSAAGRYQFTGTTAGAALNGRTAPAGGTWATAGASGTDFAFADDLGGEQLKRTAGPNRFGLLGSAMTDMEVAVTIPAQSPEPTSSNQFGGVVARYVDTSNYVRGDYSMFASAQRVVTLEAVVAGSQVASTSDIVSLPSGSSPTTLRLIVFA